MATEPQSIDTGVYLSVVIPTFNEEARIRDSLERVLHYLREQTYGWEVLVVDDGSRDDTRELVEQASSQDSRISLLPQVHRGKGHAVKVGLLATRGKYRFQCDADLSMPIEQLSRFLPPTLDDYDVAVGSREAPGARRIGEPAHRRLMGRVYNLLVRSTGVRLRDTQCGFKCYAGPEAHRLFTLQRLDGFGFDVEILFLARQHNLRVKEVAIDWYYQSESKVRPARDTLRMIRELASIRWNQLRGYYSPK